MTNPWKTGCLQCLVHTPTCIDHCFCYPCATSRLCMVAQEPAQVQTMSVLHCLCATPLVHFYSCRIRTLLGERYKIEESMISTACTSFLCPCFSNMQVHREASLRKEWPGGSCMEKNPWDGN